MWQGRARGLGSSHPGAKEQDLLLCGSSYKLSLLSALMLQPHSPPHCCSFLWDAPFLSPHGLCSNRSLCLEGLPPMSMPGRRFLIIQCVIRAQYSWRLSRGVSRTSLENLSLHFLSHHLVFGSLWLLSQLILFVYCLSLQQGSCLASWQNMPRTVADTGCWFNKYLVNELS